MCTAEFLCWVLLILVPIEDGEYMKTSVPFESRAECGMIAKMVLMDYEKTKVSNEADKSIKVVCFASMTI